MSAKSCVTSRLVSADVGSSMTRIARAAGRRSLAEAASALAISTICRCARPRRPTGARGSSVMPRSSSSADVRSCERAPVDDAAPARRQLAEEDVLGDREVRDEVQLLVDDADAEIARIARAADLHRLTVEADLAGVLAVGAARGSSSASTCRRRSRRAACGRRRPRASGRRRRARRRRETSCGCRASRARAADRSRSPES